MVRTSHVRLWLRCELVLNGFQGVSYRLVRRVASKINKAALMQAGHRQMLPEQAEGVPVPTPIVEEDSLSGVAQAIATLVAAPDVPEPSLTRPQPLRRLRPERQGVDAHACTHPRRRIS